MQTIINIFTITGSVLGILAFFFGILSSVKDYNLGKWKKMSEIVSLTELEEYKDGAGSGIIYKDSSSNLKHLIFLIRIKSDNIAFKGFFKNRIQDKLIQIVKQYNEISNEVQVPKWKLWSEDIEFLLDKDYIHLNAESIKKGEEIVNKSIGLVHNKAKKIKSKS